MPKLNFDCEELLNWWEPKADVSFIFKFNWRSPQQLREAITIFLSSRLHAVARRASTAISENGCPHLKSAMASNPETPPDLLEFLSEVSPRPVLLRIAENPNTSRETLSKLAFHDDPEVRSAVADNSATPESCFRRLAHDESVDVRHRVAENPHAPVASLYALLKDENPYVCHRARQTLSRILSDTITLSTRLMVVEELELRPDLVRQDLSARFNKQLIEELNDICGGDVIPMEFSHQSKAKV